MSQRKPLVLRLLNGSAAHNPSRVRDETRVAPRDPKPALPPGALDAVAQPVRERYRWLCAEFLLPLTHGRPDGLVILHLAETMIQCEVAAGKVAEHGQLMRHPKSGKPGLQPYFSAWMALNESVRKQMSELGFTPNSRLRHAPPGGLSAPSPAGWDEID